MCFTECLEELRLVIRNYLSSKNIKNNPSWNIMIKCIQILIPKKMDHTSAVCFYLYFSMIYSCVLRFQGGCSWQLLSRLSLFKYPSFSRTASSALSFQLWAHFIPYKHHLSCTEVAERQDECKAEQLSVKRRYVRNKWRGKET